jgi:AhpD family alkylhydroperoxidase
VSLAQRDKELVAIGASIGALCRPCIDHHIAAGRGAGLSEAELTRAVRVAQAAHHLAEDLLFRHTEELIGAAAPSGDVGGEALSTSAPDELVGLGASIGANCHPVLERHINATLEQGLTPGQVRSAIRTAEIVQHQAAEITAGRASAAMDAVQPAPVTVP